MKTLEIEVPDQVAEALKGLVEKGWFASEAEAARLALADSSATIASTSRSSSSGTASPGL
jgi:Arc/MetJ-type ribon-helix-helix transcriptional regulator